MPLVFGRWLNFFFFQRLEVSGVFQCFSVALTLDWKMDDLTKSYVSVWLSWACMSTTGSKWAEKPKNRRKKISFYTCKHILSRVFQCRPLLWAHRSFRNDFIRTKLCNVACCHERWRIEGSLNHAVIKVPSSIVFCLFENIKSCSYANHVLLCGTVEVLDVDHPEALSDFS